jgi:hypothetical protein
LHNGFEAIEKSNPLPQEFHMTTLRGACHCNTIRIAIEFDGATTGLSPRRCSCSFCRKHANLYVSASNATLEISVAEEDSLNRYQFGHQTAEFLICRKCGIMPAVVSQIDDQLFGLANANVLDPVPAFDAQSTPIGDYEASDVLAWRAWRREHWINNVVLS